MRGRLCALSDAWGPLFMLIRSWKNVYEFQRDVRQEAREVNCSRVRQASADDALCDNRSLGVRYCGEFLDGTFFSGSDIEARVLGRSR